MVGHTLREARESQSESLGQVADRTKIPVHILTAIESEDFDAVPGGLFRRGFLRAYAKEVGLDPEETVQGYINEFEPPPPPDPGGAEVVPLEESATDITAPEMEHLERRMVHGQWMGSAVVVLVGVLVYFLLARQNPGEAAGAAANAGAPPAQIAGTAGTADAVAVPVSAVAQAWTSALHLEIQPGGPCWVAASSDGRQAIQRLMNAGEREILDANDEATLRVGDAAACAFSINGAAARPAGPAGQPVTLHITKQNYKEFVNRAPAPRLTLAPIPSASAPSRGAPGTLKPSVQPSQAQPPAPAGAAPGTLERGSENSQAKPPAPSSELPGSDVAAASDSPAPHVEP